MKTHALRWSGLLLTFLGLLWLSGCPCKNVPLSTKQRAAIKIRSGIVALAQNKLEEAENACTLAKKFNPCAAEAYNCLGLVAFRRGQLAKADKLFKYAIYLSGDFAQARNNAGNVAFKRKQYKAAARWFRSVIKRYPCNTTARYNLGLTLMRQRNWKLARQNAVRLKICLLDRKLNAATAHYLLGFIEFNRKDYKRSLSHLADAFRTAPTFADAQLLACKAQYQLSQFMAACAHCKQALKLRPKHLPTQGAMRSLSTALAKLNKRCL